MKKINIKQKKISSFFSFLVKGFVGVGLMVSFGGGVSAGINFGINQIGSNNYLKKQNSNDTSNSSTPTSISTSTCLSGSYLNSYYSLCTPCPAGKYQPKLTNTGGLVSCIESSSGYYVTEEGSSSQTACPAGTYQDNPGKDFCKLAPAGYFISSTGSTSLPNKPNCTKPVNSEFDGYDYGDNDTKFDDVTNNNSATSTYGLFHTSNGNSNIRTNASKIFKNMMYYKKSSDNNEIKNVFTNSNFLKTSNSCEWNCKDGYDKVNGKCERNLEELPVNCPSGEYFLKNDDKEDGGECVSAQIGYFAKKGSNVLQPTACTGSLKYSSGANLSACLEVGIGERVTTSSGVNIGKTSCTNDLNNGYFTTAGTCEYSCNTGWSNSDSGKCNTCAEGYTGSKDANNNDICVTNSYQKWTELSNFQKSIKGILNNKNPLDTSFEVVKPDSVSDTTSLITGVSKYNFIGSNLNIPSFTGGYLNTEKNITSEFEDKKSEINNYFSTLNTYLSEDGLNISDHNKYFKECSSDSNTTTIDNYFTSCNGNGNSTGNFLSLLNNYNISLNTGTGYLSNYLAKKDDFEGKISTLNSKLSNLTDENITSNFSNYNFDTGAILNTFKSINSISKKIKGLKSDLSIKKAAVNNFYKNFITQKQKIYLDLASEFNSRRNSLSQKKFPSLTTNNSEKYSQILERIRSSIGNDGNFYCNTSSNRFGAPIGTSRYTLSDFQTKLSSYTGAIAEFNNKAKKFTNLKTELTNSNFTKLNGSGETQITGIGFNTLTNFEINLNNLISTGSSLNNNISGSGVGTDNKTLDSYSKIFECYIQYEGTKTEAQKEYEIKSAFDFEKSDMNIANIIFNDFNEKNPEIFYSNGVLNSTGNIINTLNTDYFNNNLTFTGAVLNLYGEELFINNNHSLNNRKNFIKNKVIERINSQWLSLKKQDDLKINFGGSNITADFNSDINLDVNDVENFVKNTVKKGKKFTEDIKERNDLILKESRELDNSSKKNAMISAKNNLGLLKSQLLNIKNQEEVFMKLGDIKECKPGNTITDPKTGIKYGSGGSIVCSKGFFKEKIEKQKRSFLDGIYSLISKYDLTFDQYKNNVTKNVLNTGNSIFSASGSITCRPGTVDMGNGCTKVETLKIGGMAYGSDSGPVIMDPFNCSGLKTQADIDTCRGSKGLQLVLDGSGNTMLKGIVYSPEVGAIKFGLGNSLDAKFASYGNSNNYISTLEKEKNNEYDKIAQNIYNDILKNKKVGFFKSGGNFKDNITVTDIDTTNISGLNYSNYFFANGSKINLDSTRLNLVKQKLLSKLNTKLVELKKENSTFNLAKKFLNTENPSEISFSSGSNLVELGNLDKKIVGKIILKGKLDSYISNLPTKDVFKSDIGVYNYMQVLNGYIDANYTSGLNLKANLPGILTKIKNSENAIENNISNNLVSDVFSQNSAAINFASGATISGNNNFEKISDIQFKIGSLKKQLKFLLKQKDNMKNFGKIEGCEPGNSQIIDGVTYNSTGKLPCSKRVFEDKVELEENKIYGAMFKLVSLYNNKLNKYLNKSESRIAKKGILVDSDGGVTCKPGTVNFGNGCAKLNKIVISGIAYGSYSGPLVLDPFGCNKKTNFKDFKQCKESKNGLRLVNNKGIVQLKGIIYSPEVGAISFGVINDTDMDANFTNVK